MDGVYSTIAKWSSSEIEHIAGFKVEINLPDKVLTYVLDSSVLSIVLPQDFVSVGVSALGKDFYLTSAVTTVEKF